MNRQTLEDVLKENNVLTGIKNADAYFIFESTLKERVGDELAGVEPAEDTPEDRQELYYEIQKIGDKYIRGIDTGRNILFFGLSTAFWGYYGVGLAKAVPDFASISTPGIKQAAQLVDKPLHAIADKIPFALPEYDKLGHLGMGLLIGRATEWVADKITDFIYRKKDVDDIAHEKEVNVGIQVSLQACMTLGWAMAKENLDATLGGVRNVWDVAATMGGQLINGVMSYSRSRRYSTVINEMRKRLYELGMDDDGNPLEEDAEFKEIYVPFGKASRLKKALRKGDEWQKYVRTKE